MLTDCLLLNYILSLLTLYQLTSKLQSISHMLRAYDSFYRDRKAGSYHNIIILLSNHISSHTESLWMSVSTDCAFSFLEILKQAAL